jgi:hypothetical protein
MRDNIMTLPYKEPSQTLVILMDKIVEDGRRFAAVADLKISDTSAQSPVGTTLALIDQATKILNAVHKRMHAAQAEEFQLLARCFRENPESFWQRKGKPSYAWSEQTFVQALNDCELVPQADPNTASHTQRVMKVMALKQLQQQNPSMYDPIAIDTEALQTMGWSNPEQFMVPASAQGKPPPELLERMGKLEIEKQKANSQSQLDQARAQEIMSKIGAGPEGADPMEAQMKQAELQMKQSEIEQRNLDAQLDAMNRKRDRESRERLAALRLAEDIAQNPATLPIVQQFIDPQMLQRLEGNEPPLLGEK